MDRDRSSTSSARHVAVRARPDKTAAARLEGEPAGPAGAERTHRSPYRRTGRRQDVSAERNRRRDAASGEQTRTRKGGDHCLKGRLLLLAELTNAVSLHEWITRIPL